MKSVIFVFWLAVITNPAICVEKEMTVNVEPGKEDCFYQEIKQGETIEFEYQVIDGGHGDLDVTFRIADPRGRILIADFKKPENTHRVEALMTGDYRFCFDNTYSSYNTKTVFFELLTESDQNLGSDESIDMNKIEGLKPEEVYEMKIQDIQEAIVIVRNNLIKARHFQELIKSFEARDRNIAEENYFKVNMFSLLQISVMILVGLVQVIMVKSLFDDSSRVHKVWKKLDTN